MIYDSKWVWSVDWVCVCMLTIHLLPGLRGHLHGDRGHSMQGARNCESDTHAQTALFIPTQATCKSSVCKAGLHEKCLQGIVEECACVCDLQGHTLRHNSSLADRTERGLEGSTPLLLLLCACVCVSRIMMRQDSWNELPRFHGIFQTEGRGLSHLTKAFVIDGDGKRHRGADTNTPAILGVWTAAEPSDISPPGTISSCLPKLTQQDLYTWKQ